MYISKIIQYNYGVVVTMRTQEQIRKELGKDKNIIEKIVGSLVWHSCNHNAYAFTRVKTCILSE